MSFIETFATQVRAAYTNQDQTLFSQLITIDVNSANVSSLSRELVHVRKRSISFQQLSKSLSLTNNSKIDK